MNKAVILTIIGIASVGLGMVLAQKMVQPQTTLQNGSDQPAAQEVFQPQAATQNTAGQPVQVGNRICPVSGRPIGTMGPGVEETYKGKIYHLCCGGCIGIFESDPERYSKIAEDEVRAGN